MSKAQFERIKRISLALARRTMKNFDKRTVEPPPGARAFANAFWESLQDARPAVQRRHNATDAEMGEAIDMWIDSIEASAEQFFPPSGHA